MSHSMYEGGIYYKDAILRDVPDLVAIVPYALGFHPEHDSGRHIVAVGVRGGTVAAVRPWVDEAGDDYAPYVAARIAQTVHAERLGYCVVVGYQAQGTAWLDERRAQHVQAVAEALHGHVTVAGAFVHGEDYFWSLPGREEAPTHLLYDRPCVLEQIAAGLAPAWSWADVADALRPGSRPTVRFDRAMACDREDYPAEIAAARAARSCRLGDDWYDYDLAQLAKGMATAGEERAIWRRLTERNAQELLTPATDLVARLVPESPHLPAALRLLGTCALAVSDGTRADIAHEHLRRLGADPGLLALDEDETSYWEGLREKL